jgi:hypothetical protein
MKLPIVATLIGFVCLGLAATAEARRHKHHRHHPSLWVSTKLLPAYGFAGSITQSNTAIYQSPYFDGYHPCPFNGHPDNICLRQNPWPSGQ